MPDLPKEKAQELTDLYQVEGPGPQLVFYRIKGQGLRILGPVPRFTLMSVETLVESAGSLDVTGELISIWDQVEYWVIGWDADRGALILALAADDRPEEWKVIDSG